MADKKLSYGQIANKNLLNPLVKEIEAVNNVLKLTEKQLKEVIAIIAEMSKKTPLDSLKNITKVQKGVDQLGDSLKKLDTVEKEKLRLDKKLKELNDQRAKGNAVLKEQITQRNRVLKQSAKESLGLINIYQKESKRLADLRIKYKNVALSEGETSKQARKLRKEITKLDGRLKKVDSNVGQFQRSVGNYGKAWSGVGNVLRSAGLIGGVAGVIMVFKNVVKVFAEFEKSVSELKAITGGTREEINLLRGDAQELGATTAFTASEVVKLQTAYARLGFPVDEIREVTASTLDAAAAFGSGLAETATLTGSTLKAFGLEASDAARVNDVLVKSTTATALDFQKLSASMSTIAPVASKFGFSLEGTTALLGELSNAGFDASSAATATRNIMLNLADANGSLAKSLKEPVKDIPSLVKGLKQLTDDGIDLGKALQLTDKRSVAAFSTFLSGADNLEKLNEQLKTSAGTASEIAEIQLDNFAGDITKLESAWQGLILSIENGEGAIGSFLRTTIQGITKLLSIMGGFDDVMEDVNEELFQSALANQELANSTEALLGEYEELQEKGLERTAEETQRLDEITLDLRDSLGESVTAINDETGALELNTEAVKEQIKIKRLSLDQDASQLASRLKGVQDRIASEQKLEAQLKLVDETQQKRVENLRKEGESLEDFAARNEKNQQAIAKGLQSRSNLLGQIEKINKLRKEEADILEDLEKLNFNQIDVDNLFTETVKKNSEEKKKADNSAIKRRKALIELQKIELQAEIKRLQETAKNEELSLKERLAANELIVQKRIQLAKLAKDASLNVEKALLREEKQVIKARFEEAVDQAKIGGEKFSEALFEALSADKLSANLDLILKDRISRQKIALNEEQKNIEEAFLLGEITRNERNELIQLTEEEHNNELLENEISFLESKAKIQELSLKEEEKLSQLRLDLAKNEADQLAELQEKQLEKLKEATEAVLSIVGDAISKAFEKRISEIDKEISAEEKRADRLRELAAQGNEDAQNNLAVTQKRQAELALQRERQLQKQKQSELALAAVETYSSKVTSGDKNPLASTIADVALLQAFVASLPAFYEGSERVGDDLNPTMSGKDGHLIRVDGDERILNPAQSKLIPKDMSNMQLAMLASNAQKTTTINGGNGNNAALISEIKDLKRITESKPVYMGRDYDSNRKAITDTIASKGKLERRHRKNGSIWG